MSGIEGFRDVKPEIQDLMAGWTGGAVAESTIAEFCKGCDFLAEDGKCQRVGENNQGRYATRKWCGWAAVEGVRGSMTDDGFIEGRLVPGE